MHKWSKSTIELDQQNMVQNYGIRNLTLVRGKGSYVWDNYERKYLDFTSGIAVNAFGHCFPPVVRAAKKQLKKLMHTSNLYLNEPSQKLADLILSQTNLKKAFFCNSGTEANEAAIKFARGSRSNTQLQIISFEKSFHGRTYGSLSATGQIDMKTKFGPMLHGFKTLPLNDCEKLIKECEKRACAILVEPLLVEGGVLSLEADFIEVIKECQDKGALLICDEVQTGLGRLGSFLASELIGLKPDIVTLAKALGGGLPLAAVLVTDEIGKTIHPGDHGSTFGGNLVSCAAAIEIVKAVIKSKNKIKEKSVYFREKLDKWVQQHFYLGLDPLVLGSGLIFGLKSKNENTFFLEKCREHQLLLLKAGPYVVRILPPLNVTYKEIDECIKKMNEAF